MHAKEELNLALWIADDERRNGWTKNSGITDIFDCVVPKCGVFYVNGMIIGNSFCASRLLSE